jgi:hypothetical protein
MVMDKETIVIDDDLFAIDDGCTGAHDDNHYQTLSPLDHSSLQEKSTAAGRPMMICNTDEASRIKMLNMGVLDFITLGPGLTINQGRTNGGELKDLALTTPWHVPPPYHASHASIPDLPTPN